MPVTKEVEHCCPAVTVTLPPPARQGLVSKIVRRAYAAIATIRPAFSAHVN